MNIKWVADFRDPITYGKRFHSSITKIYNIQKSIQDDTFKYADKIVGLSSSYGLIFHDQYAGEYDDKFEFIPTGVDDDYLPEKQVEKDNTLLFVGEYLKEYDDYFFRFYKEAIKGIPENKVPKINIIGNKEINESIALSHVKNLELTNNVTFIDHIPQSELYERIEKSKYVLLINGDKAYWWCIFAKLTDYMALKSISFCTRNK
jgi:glycosyltransferase involved in cell wall biosynthesis